MVLQINLKKFLHALALSGIRDRFQFDQDLQVQDRSSLSVVRIDYLLTLLLRFSAFVDFAPRYYGQYIFLKLGFSM